MECELWSLIDIRVRLQRAAKVMKMRERIVLWQCLETLKDYGLRRMRLTGVRRALKRLLVLRHAVGHEENELTQLMAHGSCLHSLLPPSPILQLPSLAASHLRKRFSVFLPKTATLQVEQRYRHRRGK